jgi:adenylate cyclase
MSETRKTAAILAADVVGFSRMASADEDGTLARLRTLRSELIDPRVASQNGRVFKRTGDRVLAEFRSVVEAVRCAITIQTAMIVRNVGISADQRIDFRIGVHLGDVVEGHRRIWFPFPRTSGDSPSGPQRRETSRLSARPRKTDAAIA